MARSRLTWRWLGLALLTAGPALAGGNHAPVHVPSAYSRFGDTHLTTALVKDGHPNATIITGASGEHDALALSIQQVIERITGARVPIATDQSPAAEVPVRGNLIAIGNRFTNNTIWQLCDRDLCILDSEYPGRGGHVVRTLHNPFGDGSNVVFVGGSDTAGTAAAVRTFAHELRRAGGTRGSLAIGWLMEIELGRGFDPRRYVEDMRVWNSSEWYGSARDSGWNDVSKQMAVYYLTGRESDAREALRLVLSRTSSEQQPGADGGCLTLLLWDLVEESPVFTDAERLEAADALTRGSFVFFDRTYVHDGTRRLYLDWDFVTNQPQHEGAPSNWEAPRNYRDGTYDFEVEVLSVGKTGIPVLIQFGWINSADDPEIRHIAGPTIRFDRVGTYRLSGAVSKLPIYYGAGENRDKRCTIWDWGKPFKADSLYTLIRPAGDPPAEAGFPYTVHVRVTIHPAYRRQASPGSPVGQARPGRIALRDDRG
jgi:hypothetical protein